MFAPLIVFSLPSAITTVTPAIEVSTSAEERSSDGEAACSVGGVSGCEEGEGHLVNRSRRVSVYCSPLPSGCSVKVILSTYSSDLLASGRAIVP